MMKRLGLITLALLFAIAATAGITRISSGSATPTNCVAGNLFIKTSATVGLYYCSTPGSPGTWTQVGAGSGTVSTTGSPANGNLAKFSGSATVHEYRSNRGRHHLRRRRDDARNEWRQRQHLRRCDARFTDHR
jgi:hypothetical protein